MFNLSKSQAIFNGGNYTQVNNIQRQTPWDRLQSAAAPSAFHDAGDAFDAPKCHPNTRVAVTNELRDFALRRGDTGSARILWLNGPAGAGKSAIARSLCEECAAANSLLASFFFNRSDASRNNHKSFVATIAYQIVGYIPEQNQSLILDAIERDPLIFTRSLGTQFQVLIVRPLHDLFESGHFAIMGRRLIVIDGLDECSDDVAQLDVLGTIQKTSNQADVPFVFLVTSRPENELQTFFRSSSITHLLHKLQLDDSYLPDADIERFLVDKLQEIRNTHPLKDSLPPRWPSAHEILDLVRKSSGQFMYASVVVKYVTSIRHQPQKRLRYVLELCPPKGDLPFAELDALFTHILSKATANTDLALRTIGYSICGTAVYTVLFTIEQIARITRVDPNDLLAVLSDLSSLLNLSITQNGERTVRLSHKSFLDYLFDATRSGKYHLDETQVISELMSKGFRYISDVVYTPDSLETRYNIIKFWNRYKYQLINDISSSYKDLMSFSPINCYRTFPDHKTRSAEAITLFTDIFWDNFFIDLMCWLHNLVGSQYADLYYHYLNQFCDLLDQHPDVYQSHMTILNHGHPFLTIRVIFLATLFVLAKPSRIQGLHAVFVSVFPQGLDKCGSSFDHSLARRRSNLLVDATLQCINYLKEHSLTIDPTLVADIIIYLTWAIQCVGQSPELEAACHNQEPIALITNHQVFPLLQGLQKAIDNYYNLLVKKRANGDFSIFNFTWLHSEDDIRLDDDSDQ